MKKLLFLTTILMLTASASFSQKITEAFFDDVTTLLQANVNDGRVNYGNLVNSPELMKLMKWVSVAELDGVDDNTKQAFYVNAYNLHVINKVVKAYPTTSVLNNGGFFEKDLVAVAGKSLTLNDLEKNELIKVYKDPRFHFVLVCGALGCPPIIDTAYTPELLESQKETQARAALNNPAFIQVSSGKVGLSKIFDWYASEFGSNKGEVLEYINSYRTVAIPTSSKVSYYDYDWSINELEGGSSLTNPASAQGSNASRYIVSSTIPKGTFEFKAFNNLYSQTTSQLETNQRSSFFTTLISAMYGLNDQFNIGVTGRWRKVRNNPLPSSPFSVFGSGDVGSSRSGITAIGPQIRWAPVPKWSNFSIQSSLVFPIGEDLAGSATQPYIDWNGPTWWTQFFNDFSIGDKFSLFTEIDLLIEDIGPADNGNISRVSTPVVLIFSYVPTNQITIYTIGGYSPFWQESFDYFRQYGLGAKYQFTPNYEIELLYTDFTNQFIQGIEGQAQTINLGLRVNI